MTLLDDRHYVGACHRRPRRATPPRCILRMMAALPRCAASGERSLAHYTQSGGTLPPARGTWGSLVDLVETVSCSRVLVVYAFEL